MTKDWVYLSRDRRGPQRPYYQESRQQGWVGFAFFVGMIFGIVVCRIVGVM